MRELRSGLRRGRSAATVGEVERSVVEQGSSAMVIRRKRSIIKKNKQPEPEPEVEQQQQQQQDDRELETRCFDEIREIGLNVVGDLEMDDDYHDAEEHMETDTAHAAEQLEEEEEEDQGNTTPTFTSYKAPGLELRRRSPIAQMALHINDEMSAKKRHLEKGLLRQTLLHEPSNNCEMDDEKWEESVPLAAPEFEVTNHNYEMYDHKHEVSVPVDIPECETAKDVVAAPVAERTRLLGKRKSSGAVGGQPNLEDHLIEAPEEFDTESGMKRNVRGPTLLPHIFNINNRHRKVIEYNEHGQPIGQFSSELASFMGVLARQMVPIVHEKWKTVPSTLKEELWRCLEAKYVLEASSRKLLVNGIGDKWRSFKSTLTRKYVLPFKEEPDRLIHPPPMYRFIKQEHWDEFVKSRLNDAFQALHEAQSERRGKNIYPHRLGRTGYAGLVEKMIKSDGVTPEEIDRCVLWKKARQNKNGEYDDDVTREQAEIIDELKKQVDNGSLVCDGNIDVLTMALGTPEHSGRVRGGGKFVSQSTFFRKPKRQGHKIADKLHEQRKLIESKWQEERVSRLRVEEQLLDTQNMVSRLEETLTNFMQNELASVSTMLPSNNNEDLEGVGPSSTSTMVPVNKNGNLGKKLALTSNRVPINNKENLGKGPALTSTRENLGKGPASTSNRVHPKNNEKLGNSPASSSGRANSNNYEPSTSSSSQSRAWRNDEENLPVVQVTPLRHVARSVKDSNVSPFQRFYNRASQIMTGSIPFITVPVDSAVFGTDMELYLDLDDVQYMCHMEDLSENCVMAYIKHLYDMLMKKGIQHKYEFINPVSVSAAKDANLSKTITSRLMNTNCEWVFVPVNSDGAHWLLIAINMVAMSCYWLDPSGLPTRYNIKPFVTIGLKGLHKDGVRRSSPIWYNIKCPKQKNSVECGFYVMKFMREIIDDPNMFTRSEPFPQSTYEQDEIDEVRLEWIQTVEAYV
ncbi:uncharacterized protein LOC113280890 isoform X2 [Papaver somniferum]|uniref:uncharacterized protein LOC113280890 isoform X2 n=1 Tax=Papaver somniferum TaxID=3469 RepID=UPI000E703164|nr:uncharacterized protein LOC113280890 isoform X2 [Papaver somniferum]